MSRLITKFSLGLFFFIAAAVAQAQMVSVSVEVANLRSGPGLDHPEQWRVIKGFPLETVKTEGEWVQVRDFEGDVNWISQRLLNKDPHVIVTGDIVNLRDQAATTGRIVGKVKFGTVMQKLGSKAGWVQVKLEDTVAWISTDFVWGFK